MPKRQLLKTRHNRLKMKKVLKNVDINIDGSNVTLAMKPQNTYQNDILGYEVVRVTRSQGQVQKEVVGLTTTDTFTDAVNLGSRAVSYEVYAIGKDRYRSSVYTTETHKVISDGSYDNSLMTVSTNMKSSLDEQFEANDGMPCETITKHAIDMLLDNKKDKEYVEMLIVIQLLKLISNKCLM